MSLNTDDVRKMLDKLDELDPGSKKVESKFYADLCGLLAQRVREVQPKKSYYSVRLEGDFYAASYEEAVKEFIKWMAETPYEYAYQAKKDEPYSYTDVWEDVYPTDFEEHTGYWDTSGS